MTYIRASIITIELQSGQYVQKPFPKNLHGLCYFLAGDEYPHGKYSPPEFHPFIQKWKASKQWGTSAIIQISSMNEQLTLNILQSLEKNKKIRLGSSELDVGSYKLMQQEKIQLDPQNSIPVPPAFKIQFITPTQFRTRKTERYETKAYPDIKLIVRSVARNLHILYGVKVSLQEQDELIDRITLLDAVGYPLQTRIARTASYESSFVGELHLSCSNLSENQKKVLGLLLRTAKYTGVGYNKGYGYGYIQIKRPSDAYSAKWGE